MKLNRTILAVAAMVVAAGVIAQRQGVRYEARLSSSTSAKGKVRFSPPFRTRQSEFQAEGENLAPNAQYTVNLSTGSSFSATTDGLGNFSINIVFRGGSVQPPVITTGTTAWVTNAAGATVMAGTFAPR